MHHAPGPQGRALRQHLRCLPHQLLTEYQTLRAEFGDVVRLPRFPHPLYLVSHPQAVQHILRDHASNYRKGVLFKPIAAVQGQGLLTSDGERWRHQRRLLQQAFRPRQLMPFGAIMTEEVQAVVQSWRRLASTGDPINVAAWMHRLTFRVVGRALLGIGPEALDDLGRQLQIVSRQLFPHLSTHMTRTWQLPTWLPTPRQQRFRRALAMYHLIAQQLVTARREVMPRETEAPRDLLAMLIAACDDPTDDIMTAQQLRDEIITIIGAGVETSAQALSWTWYLLARHSEAAQQVEAELDTVLGSRPPTPEDLPHLPYGRMVLDEAMRLYPPSAVLPRQANADDTIGGYTIPKNAVVLMSQYVTHRHPDFWSDPERFCPTRFTPEQIAARHRFAYFPFGEGPRICIGKPFALMEMHLILATIAQAYRLRLVPDRPVIPHLATTLHPRDGLWMSVQART